MEKIIIAAVAKNGIIGRQGEMPWHSREELQYFKAVTLGSPVIMGRKTFESFKKPLPGRLNIIISRNNNLNYPFEGLMFFSSIEEALEYCKSRGHEKVFIAGGAEIYKQTLPITDKLSISRMNFEAEGDTYFPEIDLNDWELESVTEHKEFNVHIYVRKARV